MRSKELIQFVVPIPAANIPPWVRPEELEATVAEAVTEAVTRLAQRRVHARPTAGTQERPGRATQPSSALDARDERRQSDGRQDAPLGISQFGEGARGGKCKTAPRVGRTSRPSSSRVRLTVEASSCLITLGLRRGRVSRRRRHRAHTQCQSCRSVSGQSHPGARK